jgi:hypothetical protein
MNIENTYVENTLPDLGGELKRNLFLIQGIITLLVA